jgi:hypothetical protein
MNDQANMNDQTNPQGTGPTPPQDHSAAFEGLKRGPKAADPVSAEARANASARLPVNASASATPSIPSAQGTHGSASPNASAQGTPPAHDSKFQKFPARPANRGEGYRGGDHARRPQEGKPATGYFKAKGNTERLFEDKIGPGASYIAIPKWRNKRAFPFITPQEALKKHAPYAELRPSHTPEGVLRIIPF